MNEIEKVVNLVRERMDQYGHTPGSVRLARTKTGKQYAYVRCANVSGLKCSTEAEVSIERQKLTLSTVSFYCQYQTAEQKAAWQTKYPRRAAPLSPVQALATYTDLFGRD